VLGLTLFILSGCGLGETREKHYATWTELVEDGAVERGWVPACLPESATDIREIHNLDANWSLLTFTYDSLDAEALGALCPAVTVSQVRLPERRARWWPAELVGSGGPGSSRFLFFDCGEQSSGMYVALDERERRAYVWRP
jgi:hypothetical protein